MSKLSETMLISVVKNFKFFSFHFIQSYHLFKIRHNQRFLRFQFQGIYGVYDNYKQKTKDINDSGALVCLLLATSIYLLSTVFQRHGRFNNADSGPGCSKPD